VAQEVVEEGIAEEEVVEEILSPRAMAKSW
jgi:hypothetical protein